jgi:hypothetical protein
MTKTRDLADLGGGFIQEGTGAVQRTVESKLQDTVSVLDFIPESEHAAIKAGTSTYDATAAIQAALNASNNVFMSDGTYLISSPLIMERSRQNLRGASKDTVIKARLGFTGTTIGGSTGSAMIWYQNPVGNWDGTGWLQGGEISDLTLWGDNKGVEGIRYNRVTSGQVFKNLRIWQCTIGIYGTKWGWVTKFDNLHVEECSITSIRLHNGYNGCTFTNCFLYGANVVTDVHLDMYLDCFGNSFIGGAIEKCKVGARLEYAQVAFHGVDFEVNTEKYISITGIYSGPTLNFANPTVTVTGCTFVDAPSIVGIEVVGGAAEVHGNFFLGSAPASGVYAIRCTATGDGGNGISESQNVYRNFGDPVDGFVWTKLTSLRASRASGIPTLYGAKQPNFNSDTVIAEYSALGDYDLYSSFGETTYVKDYYARNTGALTFFSNFQGGSPATTYGKSRLSASVTQSSATIRSTGLITDTFSESVRPLDDNATKLGSAANRWSEVFAGTGTINTSDANDKQQVRSLFDAEKAVATELKGKIKAFKFNDAVSRKGDEARTHVGVIAQEVEQAFIDNGLDPEQYGVFCRDIWYTVDGTQVLPNESGEYPDEAIKREQLGIRYDQLFAFILAAL